MKVSRLENRVCGGQPWRADVFSRILINRESRNGIRKPAWVCWGLQTELTHEKLCERWKQGQVV